jgi:hypothetical protein
VQRDGQAFDLVEVAAPNEHHLQEIVKAQPQLIPAEDLGIDGDLLVVGRETTLASGLIDLLCLSRSGEIVLIEFKTGPQNPDFRHALAQVIDYGSDLWRMGIEDFDRGVVQRYLSSPRCDPAFAGARDLNDAISRSNWDLGPDELTVLRGRIAEVLNTGDFIYVVAAQRFTPSMQTSLEYLNGTMRFGRFYLVEVIRLEGSDLAAHAAQVVAAPARHSAPSSASHPETQANENDFLAQLGDASYRDALRDIFAACAGLGVFVTWRSKGASLQIATPDRAAPLSIGWVLPEGSSWQGTRHLTLGVDRTSLAETPSVAAAVLDYASRIERIEGGRPLTSKKLSGRIFDPEVLPRVAAQLTEELDRLVRGINAE